MSQLMTDYPCPHYNTVAASQTTQVLSQKQGQSSGTTGDYLESITIIAGSTTPGAITLFDGATAVLTTIVGSATVMPYVQPISIRAYSKSGSWNITTGATVSVLAVGKFS